MPAAFAVVLTRMVDAVTELALELAEGQADWLAEVASDVCRVTRAAIAGDDEFVAAARDGTSPTIDEATGQYPAQGTVIVYEGPCRMQVKADINSNVVETTAGEREWTYLTSQLQVPVLAPTGHALYVTGDPAAIDVDNVCKVLSAPYDPAMVDAEFNITGPFHKSQAVYRRFRVREVAA